MARRVVLALALAARAAYADDEVECPWGNPTFEVADDAECPKKSEIPDLPKCHHDCLCYGDYCLGRNKCGAAKMEDPNCHGESVYRITKVPQPDDLAGVAQQAECPMCAPAGKCPLLRILRPEECAIVDEDPGRDDEPCIREPNRHLEVGEVCFASQKVRERCELPQQRGVCADPTALDYVVTNVGGGCPSLERVAAEDCPAQPELLRACQNECVCAGDFCLGGGARKCGGANDLANCDGDSVYYVTSHDLVARGVDCAPCACADDPVWVYGSLENPRHTCHGPEGVAEDPKVRCETKENLAGVPAKEACPVTCGTCDTQPTPRPTAYMPTPRPTAKPVFVDDEPQFFDDADPYQPTPRPTEAVTPRPTKKPTPLPTKLPTRQPTLDVVDDDLLPTPRPTLPCPELRVIDASECPEETNIGNCDEPGLPVGALCEGDGECGTDRKLDNCDLADMYEVVAATTRFPTGKATPRPTPVIISPGCPIIAAAAEGQCPPNLNLAPCDTPGLRPGDFCEGDGECGTDRKLDNCDSATVTGADIYFVVSDAYQPTLAPTFVFGVRTSLRFLADELEERIPDYARSQQTANEVCAALVRANIALEDHCYAARFVDVGVDYKGTRAIVAVADLGFPDVPGSNIPAENRGDMAGYIGRKLAEAARGETEPSMARALSKENHQLFKSFDAEATEAYASSDTAEESTPTPYPTPVPRPKSKKSDDDELIPGVDEGGAIVIILLLVLLGCLIIAALAAWCMSSSGSSGSAFKSTRRESSGWDNEVELAGKPYRDADTPGRQAGASGTSVNPMVYPADDAADLEDVDMAY